MSCCSHGAALAFTCATAPGGKGFAGTPLASRSHGPHLPVAPLAHSPNSASHGHGKSRLRAVASVAMASGSSVSTAPGVPLRPPKFSVISCCCCAPAAASASRPRPCVPRPPAPRPRAPRPAGPGAAAIGWAWAPDSYCAAGSTATVVGPGALAPVAAPGAPVAAPFGAPHLVERWRPPRGCVVVGLSAPPCPLSAGAASTAARIITSACCASRRS
eukprot:4071089-Pleurochrysis_carterae.AAC.1